VETAALFELIERISALVRSEERKKCTMLGLQSVHLQVLTYVSSCNKYSNTPAALAAYLGMTRGTVSQTLLLLEKKGYLKKTPDATDRRLIHLELLPEGHAVLEQAKTSELFHQAATLLTNNVAMNYETAFTNALTALQKANQSQSFGLCKTCRHFTTTGNGFFCALTKESLTESDSEKICYEHTPP
jgi:DNA-binding MarR family transcriptional regulator